MKADDWGEIRKEKTRKRKVIRVQSFQAIINWYYMQEKEKFFNILRVLISSSFAAQRQMSFSLHLAEVSKLSFLTAHITANFFYWLRNLINCQTEVIQYAARMQSSANQSLIKSITRGVQRPVQTRKSPFLFTGFANAKFRKFMRLIIRNSWHHFGFFLTGIRPATARGELQVWN